jgi:radical SAM protein with 4Fe4S-binding SPASM domain
MQEFHIQWHITSRCNLRCIHCYQDSFTGDDELEWRALRSICDNVLHALEQQKRSLSIALTGGEPFLKKELWHTIDYLYKSPAVSKITVITNGTIIDRHLSSILDYPLMDVYVSLDGIDSQTNDAIRGEHVFDKVLANIQLLKSHGISVFLMFTLLRRTIQTMGGVVNFAKALSVDGCILERFIPLGYGKNIKEDCVTVHQLNDLYRTIFNQCRLTYTEEQAAMYHALKIELDESGDATPHLYGAECIVAEDGCALLPDGTVLPCRRFWHPLGNLLEQPFEAIWRNSEVLVTLRDRTNLQGSCRDCRIKACRGCRALAHATTGNYCAPDPLCRLPLRG